MNPRTTWILLALALGLLTYITLFERQANDAERKADAATRLFPDFDPAQVTSLEIAWTNSFIGARRFNDRWQMAKPVYPAQATSIDEFLRSVSLLHKHDQISSKEISQQKGGLAGFGLLPAKATITVHIGTNRLSFGVGAKTLTGDRLYVQAAGSPGILVTDAAILGRLPASSDEWRNPSLVTEDRLLFDQVVVTNETSVFAIVRNATNQLWRLTRPLEAAANGSVVADLFQQLKTTRISQFVTDDLAVDMERYGLQSPKAQLTLARGTNAVFQLQLGRSPTNNPALVYARRLSHSNIVLVAKEIADLLQRPHTAFRDRTLLPFVEAAVGRVEVNASQSFALERRTNNWFIVEPFTARADAEAMRELFASLSRLEIIEFETDLVAAADLPNYGLKTPARRYVLKTAATNAVGPTNLVLAQVEFGTNRVDRIYARRGDEKSVYTVSFGVVSQLPQYAFEMRDRRIWSFSETNVVSVTLSQRGKTNRVERNAQRLWTSDQVVNAYLDEVLHRLGGLRAVSWRTKGDHQVKLLSFLETNNQLTVEVAADGKTRSHTVRFGKLAGEGHVYSAVMLEEGEWVVFLFPGPLYLELLRALGHPEPANP